MLKKIIFFAIISLAIVIVGVAMAQDATDTVDTTINTTSSPETQIDENVNPEDLDVSSPILLPDSKFYFLKNWQRAIRSIFAFGSVKKAELNLKFASERLLEAQKLAEKTNNPQILDKAVELYNRQIDKINQNIEKFKGTATSSEAVNKFLDKYVKQQILHEKILDKLEQKVPTSTLEKIQENRERHLERFGEVMQKLEDKTQVKARIQNALGAIKGSDLKDIKNLEILKNIQDKMPEQIKQQVQNVIASTTERIRERMQFLSPENQEKIENYIENMQGKIENKLEIINDLKDRLPSTGAMKQGLESVKERLQNKGTVQPQIVGGDKDEHGCIGSAGYTWCEAKQKCLRTWEEECKTEPEQEQEQNQGTTQNQEQNQNQNQGQSQGGQP